MLVLTDLGHALALLSLVMHWLLEWSILPCSEECSAACQPLRRPGAPADLLMYLDLVFAPSSASSCGIC